MISANWLRLIGVVTALSATVLLVVQIVFLRRRRIQIATRPLDRQFNKKLYMLYKILLKVPLIRRFLSSIEEKIAMSSAVSETRLIEQTIKVFATLSLLMVLALLFFASYIRHWYSWLLLIVVLYFIIEMLSDYYYGRIKLNLLEEMVVFIDYLRTTYFETGMIDDAYLSAIDRLDAQRQATIYKHANQIYQAITEADGELAIQRYYQSAPNAYLKLLAGLSHIIREHGDSEQTNGSSFVKSLTHLSGELKDDIIKRKKLLFGLKAMNIITIIPIFAMEPLKHWASHSFYPLKVFYEGALGFSLEIVLLVIVLLCFTLMRRLQDYSEFNEKRISQYKFERRIANHLSGLLRRMMPSPNNKKYRNLLDRQRRALVFIKMEYHFVHKLISASLAFVVVAVLIFTSLQISRNSILKQPTTTSGFLAGELKGKALEAALQLTAFDNEVLNAQHQWTSQSLDSYLTKQYGLSGEKKQTTVTRILKKQQKLSESKFNLIHIVILYLFTWLGWLLPEFYLYIQARLLKTEIDLEIARFQLLIMVLMDIEHLTVDQVLEWFEKFSKLFKIPLQKALMEYDAGATEALEDLKKASNKSDYQTIINHLLSSVESLTIKEAFNEFESEKLYYQDKRKLVGHNLVKNKIYIGRVIGFTPLYSLLILYFMFPLIYASIMEMQTYFDKLMLQ